MKSQPDMTIVLRSFTLIVMMASTSLSASADLMSTTRLREVCSSLTSGKNADMADMMECSGYLRGFMEGILIAEARANLDEKQKMFCPQPVKTSPMILAYLYDQFLTDHPELIAEDAQASLSIVLQRYNPCR